MAAVDPIHFVNLRKIFPSLSEVQTSYSFFYCTGTTYSEIADLTEKSSVTIKKTLVKAQENLDSPTLQSMRFTVLSRLLLCVILYEASGKPLNTSLAEAVLTTPKDNTIFDMIASLFPELTLREVKLCCLYSAGEDLKKTGLIFNLSLDILEDKLKDILLKLKSQSFQSMRVLVTNRLLMSLALVSINLTDASIL